MHAVMPENRWVPLIQYHRRPVMSTMKVIGVADYSRLMDALRRRGIGSIRLGPGQLLPSHVVSYWPQTSAGPCGGSAAGESGRGENTSPLEGGLPRTALPQRSYPTPGGCSGCELMVPVVCGIRSTPDYITNTKESDREYGELP